MSINRKIRRLLLSYIGPQIVAILALLVALSNVTIQFYSGKERYNLNIHSQIVTQCANALGATSQIKGAIQTLLHGKLGTCPTYLQREQIPLLSQNAVLLRNSMFSLSLLDSKHSAEFSKLGDDATAVDFVYKRLAATMIDKMQKATCVLDASNEAEVDNVTSVATSHISSGVAASNTELGGALEAKQAIFNAVFDICRKVIAIE
jgi:hypothetical protein